MRQLMRHLTGPAGHLVLLSGFAAYTIWYAHDAWSAQANVQNMLLIGPAAVIALAIILVIAALELRRFRTGSTAEDAEEKRPETAGERGLRTTWGTPLAAVMLLIYVLVMPFIGFDVATVLYVALSMLLQGARDWRVIVAFSLVAGLLPIWGIEALLSIPVPTLIL